MDFLKNKIISGGIVASSQVLKVDSFLHHQLDIELLEQLGQEFVRRFAGTPVTKVLTMETSGIAVAYPVARLLGVPLVYARKADSIKLDGETLVAEVPGADLKAVSRVLVSKKFLSSQDHVLVIDDILANGYSLQALISLVEDADASVEGCGIVIEKGFQEGGHRIRNLGYNLQSLAIIEAMDPQTGTVTFRE